MIYIMKLATDYAQACYNLANPDSYDAERAEEARSALQSAIEALQAECAEHKENAIRNARIAVSIRAERDALQAKLDAMGKGGPVAWQFRTNGKHWHVVQVCPPDDAYDKGTLSPLYAAPKALAPNVAWLSNVIRQVDGNNKMGAGALAEKIVEAISAHGIGGTP